MAIDYLSVSRSWLFCAKEEFELWFDFRVIQESTKTVEFTFRNGKFNLIKK